MRSEPGMRAETEKTTADMLDLVGQVELEEG